MRRFLVFMAALAAVLMTAGCATQQPSFSRAYMSRDIREGSFSGGAGVEFQPFKEYSGYSPDFAAPFVSFAPYDWLEMSFAGHVLLLVPTLDARVDLIDMFTDDLPVSLFIMGGANPFIKEEPFMYHYGAMANFRPAPGIEVYAGAGTDAVSDAWAVEGGVHWQPLEWLGFTTGGKWVLGPKGYDDWFLYVSPVFTWQGGHKKTADSP